MTQEDIEAAAAAAAARCSSTQYVKEGEAQEEDLEAPPLPTPLPVPSCNQGEKGPKTSSSRGAYLWGLARSAHASGRLAELAVSPEFNIVAHVFNKLFPRDFDRVSLQGGWGT